MPTEGFELDWNREGGLSLRDVMDEFARVTGLVVIVDEDSGMWLWGRAGRLYPVAASTTVAVPRDRVYPFVEALLRVQECVLLDVHDVEPRTVRVVSLKSEHRRWVLREAFFVPIERIETYRDHPALLVTTLLTLPDVDARHLANCLHALLTDENTQSVVPVGSNTVELTAFGPQVCNVVDMLRTAGLLQAAVFGLDERSPAKPRTDR